MIIFSWLLRAFNISTKSMRMNHGMNKTNEWKKSASVIIAAEDGAAVNSTFNYKVLTMERSESSSYFPGATVFPGGALDKSDTSQEWLQLYKKFGFNLDSFEQINPKENAAIIFQHLDRNEIPPYLSLRIAAIRETFEETGVLLCKTSDGIHKKSSCWASFITRDDLVEWQKKISRNTSEFINFCRQFDMYPDVWSLHEWSIWGSPVGTRKKSYLLIVFIAALKQIPITYMNAHEATQLNWFTPQDYRDKYKSKKIYLMPVQLYEISRLLLFHQINRLAKFAHRRSLHGTELYLGQRIYSSDGFLFYVFPGDDLYKPFSDMASVSDTYVKSIPESKIQHRIFIYSSHSVTLIIKNYTPSRSHVTPSSFKI